ncbi:ribose 5-phosphate isomerase B [Thermocrinis minervae]|uniref:Ribose-5-phosphate isomerase n=1 Tax=Thermocrinis minervae TaxID=381751 RepID=A0A1M6RRY5_9AQUI|nr:ribose 5-phosphate isomerase B [Thermocrinis minervae]SHK35271.1 ribose-5-phosphate isomerase [Thermocrinis minervae]
MRIALGADHAGFELKEEIKVYLINIGHEVLDLGTKDTTSVDYPNFAQLVAQAVQKGQAERGILICGTGIGMCIAANKFKGIRAALCLNEYMARMSRRHNDANVLCLGSRVVGKELALSIVDAWLREEFEGGRHQLRVGMIEEFELKC